jgi:hypothetical protein
VQVSGVVRLEGPEFKKTRPRNLHSLFVTPNRGYPPKCRLSPKKLVGKFCMPPLTGRCLCVSCRLLCDRRRHGLCLQPSHWCRVPCRRIPDDISDVTLWTGSHLVSPASRAGRPDPLRGSRKMEWLKTRWHKVRFQVVARFVELGRSKVPGVGFESWLSRRRAQRTCCRLMGKASRRPSFGLIQTRA